MPQTLSHIRSLLADRGLRPRQRFGQNFLHDHNQLAKLLAAAHLKPADLILEIGPGTGTLTESLLQSGAAVIACEIDNDLVAILHETISLRFPGRFTLIHADCLFGKHVINPAILTALDHRPFKLVANLPYNIASPLIISLLTTHAPNRASPPSAASRRSTSAPPCIGLSITIQREVAQRITATSGTKDFGPLAVICQLMADTRLIANVPPSCFWPAPKVTSSMIAITPCDAPPCAADVDRLLEFLPHLFRSRRKQLGSIIGRRNVLWPQGISPDMRPEDLSPAQILALALALPREFGQG